MKKLAFITLAALAVFGNLFTMQSCSDAVKKLHYDIPLNSGAVEVTVPPTNDTSSTGKLATGMTHFNIDSLIKNKTNGQLGVSNINSVKILSVKLTLLNGTATNNFANFQSCFASFYSNSNTSPYSVTIANNPDVAAYVLNLPVDPNADLQSYMKGDTFYYSVGGKLRRPITDSVTVRIEFQFNISVNG